MSYLLHKNSDLLSFNEVYKLFYKRAYLFVKSYIHDDLAAEDIASESLIKIWEVRNEEKEYYVESYLFTILRNKALDYLRHQKIEQETLSDLNNWRTQDFNIRLTALEACDPDKIFSEEIKGIMEDSLRSMSAQTAEIFKLSRFENKSNKEIAELMGVSIKTVEYHITKSLKILKKALADFLPFYVFFIYLHNV